MTKTYLDKLIENSKGFSELLKKEYRELKISELKIMLADIKKKYKDDPQRLKLLTVGYKEMIKKLKKDMKE